MTLSQAGRRISKLKGKLSEYEKRAEASNVWEEGHEPTYKFSDALEKAEEIRQELIQLGTLRTMTNAKTMIEFEGKPMTLTQAVLCLAELKGRIVWWKDLTVLAHDIVLNKASEYREGKMETFVKKSYCACPEAKRQGMVEKLQDEFDRLNDVVETTLHQTLLVKG